MKTQDATDATFDWDADKHLPEHDPDKTILQPENNLLCGVNILENQLVVHRKPLITTSSYWSTLRPGWPGYKVFLKQMANVPRLASSEAVRTGGRKYQSPAGLWHRVDDLGHCEKSPSIATQCDRWSA